MKTSFFLALGLALAMSASAQQRQAPEKYSPALKQLYAIADSATSIIDTPKPLIGISVSNSLKRTCTRSIELAGGIPVIIPATADPFVLEQTVAQLDGLMMSGGEDIRPSFYGEEVMKECGEIVDDRDQYELLLLKKAMDRNLPIFGVCRGLQIINVAMGGSLYQDIPTQRPSQVTHSRSDLKPGPAHSISIVPGSLTAQILGADKYDVNSLHHQGIKKLADGLKITAWSVPDSIPEAIEAYPVRPIMAVQFHPELNASIGDATHLRFFQHFVSQAKLFAQAKDIHSRILSVDTHCDTPMAFGRGGSLAQRLERQQVSIPKMREGFLDAQFLAAFLGQKETDQESLDKAVANCTYIINKIHTEVAKYPESCGIAITEADAWRLKAEGKRAYFIGIENGYGIGNDLKNIKKFYDKGVNYITLCHSADNQICNSSTRTADENKGLTDFGVDVVKEMNRVGMVIDLSHASMGTFWDVMKLSTKPVICSHSGAKGVHFHNRNLNDDQLRALAKNGGVIQVCIFAWYMSPNSKTTSIDDVVAHIDHCVRVAGIDHVGIGSDFDGGGGVLGCQGSNDMIRISVKLLEKGYTEEDLKKIWGGNFFRVLNANRAKR
ncbi:MAG: gamma-glutamyl-gamma-aminobutyrate hydrolase family protein [Bacteroidales bacterium]|nr:gamma-glutamyl-gamma-aminobutyrate hydrolase family protein [Bacteroidales bacterium]